MKYKVGDKVLIKDINWYNKNKDEDGDISCGEFIFVSHMSKFCGKILTIDVVFEDGTYLMKEDTDGFVFTNEMFDTFAEEEVERLTGNLSNSWVNEFELPDGYIFKDENGNVINATKIVLEKKKKEYPKTYEECCRIIGFCSDILKWDNPFRINRNTHPYIKHLDKLMGSFYKLLICRDAYWKIAGKEMGLNGPWKPDWTANDNHFYTIHTFNGKIECSATAHRNAVLIFPTEEMRDAFFDNFKEEIEKCKKLL